MDAYTIGQVIKADILERTRRISFLLTCAGALFISFLSVPKMDAPLISIVIEPSVFRQGSNATWIPIAIALFGGILFPIIGLAYAGDTIGRDRESGFLYWMRSMNGNKGNYVIGKFLSNVLLLTVMWGMVLAGAAVMLPFQFPHEALGFSEFLTPFLGIYPGMLFAAACAAVIDSVSFPYGKKGNAAGIILLFSLFLINYLGSSLDYPILRIFDFSCYRWLMYSINHAVIPILGNPVQEMGILAPRGIFLESPGTKQLVFTGLINNSSYLFDKTALCLLSLGFAGLSAVLLENYEGERRGKPQGVGRKKDKEKQRRRYAGRFTGEARLLFLEVSPLWKSVLAVLWVCACFVQSGVMRDYAWVFMLMISTGVFASMGCREYENEVIGNLLPLKGALRRQLIYDYIIGVILMLFLSAPLLTSGTGREVPGRISFAVFVPAAACLLGEHSRSRKPFEILYLLFCFLLMNLPSLLFRDSVIICMLGGTVLCLGAVFLKRGRTSTY